MTENQFLNDLEKQLKASGISDIEEILEEYREHFGFKLEEGFTEEEIAAKLSAPEEIAKAYAETNVAANSNKGFKIAGIAAIALPASLIYAVLWATVIILGAFSAVCLVLGFCLLTTINLAGLIPYMPYISSFFISFALFGLSVVCAIGTFYLAAYYVQWGRAFSKKCNGIMSGCNFPSVSLHPKLNKRHSYKLKIIAIIALAVFVSFLATGYFVSCAIAGSMEFWHIWNWFM